MMKFKQGGTALAWVPLVGKLIIMDFTKNLFVNMIYQSYFLEI